METLPIINGTSGSVFDGINMDGGTPGKDSSPGRRSRFTFEEDLLLIREVAACKAHIARNGETKDMFELAAVKANATKRLHCSISWKSLQDRYKRIQARFDRDDRTEQRMSGIGGEVSEMDEILAIMKEERDDLNVQRNEKKDKEDKRMKEKERLGSVIRMRATERRSVRDAEDNGEAGATVIDDVEIEGSGRKRKRRGNERGTDMDEELAIIEALEKADEKRVEMEEKKLALEEMRFEEEREERKRAREERKEEREAAAELELKKMRLMMEMMSGNSKRKKTDDK